MCFQCDVLDTRLYINERYPFVAINFQNYVTKIIRNIQITQPV